jgi:hypothetical protein
VSVITVKATREGLIGGRMASGVLVDTVIPFVALPSNGALRLWVRVRNPATQKSINAICLDVGPWNVADNGYVFQPATWSSELVAKRAQVRPQAETGKDLFGRVTNRAGIDLGERVWSALRMTDNTDVEWEFLL